MGSATRLILSDSPMSEIDAIYKRRAVRDYLPEKVHQSVVHALLYAAVQAPTAMREEPWSFVVIQDQDTLDRLSNSAKIFLNKEAESYTEQNQHLLEMINQPDFHVFYNASTLIVIYTRFSGLFVAADCWLAAENLMLTACAKGLGTCVIGLAISPLNSPEWREELKIPNHMTAIAPIIVGYPAGSNPPILRKPPDIHLWL